MKKNIIFLLILLIFPYYIKAVTLEEYNNAVANVAVSAGTTYADEFIYSYFWGIKNGEAVNLKSSTTNVWLKNAKNGIKSSGYEYGFKNSPGIQGSFTNKFAVYCESFVQLMVHHASNGAVSYSTDYEKIKTSELKRGDLIHFANHIAVYIDDNGDTDPNTYRVSHASGKIIYTTIDRQSDYGYRIKSSSLANLEINYVNSSYDFHDRLDDAKPIIRNLSQEGNKIRIQATDYKDYSLAARDSIVEPENYGIAYYGLSKSNNLNDIQWFPTSKTDTLDITTGELSSLGKWYVFVKDVGGNIVSSSINILNLDVTKPVIGKLTYVTSENSITITITGASDEGGIKAYNYYLDDELIKSQASNKYTFNNLEVGNSYNVRYEVVDNNNNKSSSSNISISVKKNVTNVSLEKNSIGLKPGNTYQIKPIITAGNSNYVIKYKSSNSKAVSVTNDGLITAINYGVASIVVEVDGLMATLNVTVIDYNIQIMTEKLENGKKGETYYAIIKSNVPQSTFSINSGTLPPGLKLSAEGVIGGIPTKTGKYTFGIKNIVNQEEVTKTFTIEIVKDNNSLIVIIIVVMLLGILGFFGRKILKKNNE